MTAATTPATGAGTAIEKAPVLNRAMGAPAVTRVPTGTTSTVPAPSQQPGGHRVEPEPHRAAAFRQPEVGRGVPHAPAPLEAVEIEDPARPPDEPPAALERQDHGHQHRHQDREECDGRGEADDQPAEHEAHPFTCRK